MSPTIHREGRFRFFFYSNIQTHQTEFMETWDEYFR